MGAINDIFKTHAHEYLERFGTNMPANHKKAIRDITGCKTGQFGTIVYECTECHKPHIVYMSCGNRHCPGCQHHKTTLWLERQKQQQLPGHHFMLTFTMPAEIRDFVRSHQKVCYSALFKASSKAIKKLAKDPKYMGGELPGFFGVLHTWGRQNQYHPHIHFIAPGGGISREDKTWHPSRKDFFLPVRALSKIYRAKFRDEMQKAGILKEIPAEVWKKAWNVNSQAVGSAEHCIKYLAPYVFKVGMSNSRIVRVEDRRVFFKYRKKGSRRMRTTSLEVMEFMHRFLQHVLPSGFMKVRYYGFMHPSSSVSLEEVAAMILNMDKQEFGSSTSQSIDVNETEKGPVCPHCGGRLKAKAIFFPNGLFILLDEYG